jgi:hypothetical protein
MYGGHRLLEQRATGHAGKEPDAHARPPRQPQARNLIAVLAHLQKQGDFHLEVRTEP